MKSGLGILVGVVLAATLMVGTADAKDPTGLDALPALSAAPEPIQFVGDVNGLRLGVSVVSDTEVVAYLCDGESVGVWFTGNIDLDTGEGELTSKGGGSITLALAGEPPTVTVVVDDETTTFDLRPATNGGLFRSVRKVAGHRWTTGWIADDDGTIVGLTSDESGEPVVGVNASTPVPQSLQPDPVTTGSVRCSILAGRISRQIDGTSKSSGTIAVGLSQRAAELGCAGFPPNNPNLA